MTGITLFALASFAMLGLTDQMFANNLLNNGSFQAGDFTSWSLDTTATGSPGIGFPIVTPWPLGGSKAVRYEVGQVTFMKADFEGALLLQGFVACDRTLSLAFNWAAMGDGIKINSDAGLFQLVLDGSVLNSFDVGLIDPNDLRHGTLTGTGLVTAGVHLFEIDILRPFESGQGSTPYEFVTGASVIEVSEPSSLLLLAGGTVGMAAVMRQIDQLVRPD